MKTGNIFWYDPDMYQLWYADSKTSNSMHQPIVVKKGRVTPRQIRTQLLSGKFTAAHRPLIMCNSFFTGAQYGESTVFVIMDSKSLLRGDNV